MIARRNFLFTTLGLLGTIFAPGVLCAAKKRSPGTPGVADTPSSNKGVSQLRLWKATDAVQQPISLRFLLPNKPDSAALSPLKIDAQEYQFTSYVDLPSGPLTAEVSVPGQAPIRLSRYLAVNGQMTLLVRFQNAKLSVEWINDVPTLTGGGCIFRIYNLLPASGDIEVNLGTVLNVHLPSIRSSLHLNEIKPALYPLTVKGTAGAGKDFSANLDVDFGGCRQATLLICPDAYGRIRPRINAL